MFKYRSFYLLITIVLTIVSSSYVSAEPHNLKTLMRPSFIEAENGPYRLGITQMAQSSTGLLWLATSTGIYSYDGYSYKQLDFPNKNGTTIDFGYTYSIQSGAPGVLWAATYRGELVRIDEHNRAIDVFTDDKDNPEDLMGEYANFALPLNGGVWVATNKGLNFLDEKTRKFTHFQFSELKTGSVTTISKKSDGNLFLGSKNGLFTFDTSNHSLSKVQVDGTSNLETDPVARIYEDNKGRIWVIGLYKGLTLILPSNQAIEISQYSTINDIEFTNDEIWVATAQKGIIVLDFETTEVKANYKADKYQPLNLQSNQVNYLYQDTSGLIWVSGWGARLLYVPHSLNFSKASIYSPIENSTPMAHDYIDVIKFDDGTFWVFNNDNGIEVYSKDLELLEEIDQHNSANFAFPPNKLAIATRLTKTRLVLVTVDARVFFYKKINDQKWQRIECTTNDKSNLLSSVVNLYRLRDGNILLVDSEGLHRIDINSDSEHCNINKLNIPEKHEPYSAAQITQNEILIVESGDIHRINLETLDVTEVTIPERYRGVQFTHLSTGRDGIHLFSPNGLFKILDIENNKLSVEPIHQLEGFKSVFFFDEFENYWGHSIYRLKGQKQANVFSEIDGHIPQLIRQIGAIQLANGKHLIIYRNGFKIFNTKEFKEWDFNPNIVINSASIDNKPVTGNLHNLILEAGQRDFGVSFSGLDYSAPSKLRYRFRLEGYPEQWREVDANARNANYTNIPPGSYNLRIQGSNSKGIWSPKDKSIKITILPAWNQTIWFYISLAIILAALLYCLYIWRLAYYRHKKAELESLVKERTHDLQETQASLLRSEKQASLSRLVVGVAHEINTPLGIVKMAASILERNAMELFRAFNMQKIDDKEVSSRLEKFDHGNNLLNGNLDRLSNLVSRFKQISANERTIDFIQVNVKHLLEETISQRPNELDSINIDIQCANKLEVYSSPSLLKEIVSELISNSIAHGFDSEQNEKLIIIRVICSEDAKGEIKINFEDNGRGIDQSVIDTIFDPFTATKTSDLGLGLHVIANLINIVLGGTIECKNLCPGASFTITLPQLDS